MQRQDDGILEPFPIWPDITTFDGRPWAGCVDIVTGGFPCQDISAAGKGAGITGARSGLWSEMARVIGEVRPRYVLVENSPILTSRGLGRVLGDLASLGFDARWGCISAAETGAHHKRDRMWIVANADGSGWQWPGQAQPTGWFDTAKFVGSSAAMADCDSQGLAIRQSKRGDHGQKLKTAFGNGRWPAEPDMDRVVNGVAARLDRRSRIYAIGNGQVPRVVAAAWETLR